MKVAALAILALVVLNVLVPPPSGVIRAQRETCFCGLDVCGSHVPALSPGGKMPFIPACPDCGPRSIVVDSAVSDHPLFAELIIARLNERPPQA